MQCSTRGLCTGQQRFPGWWMNCVVILLYVLCLSNFSLLLLASSTQLEPHIWYLYQSHPLLLLFPFPSAASDTAESAGRGHVQDHISHNTARILKSDHENEAAIIILSQDSHETRLRSLASAGWHLQTFKILQMYLTFSWSQCPETVRLYDSSCLDSGTSFPLLHPQTH